MRNSNDRKCRITLMEKLLIWGQKKNNLLSKRKKEKKKIQRIERRDEIKKW